MVISSPSNLGDVQQELIAEIHRTSIWPVVTVDGNISKHDKTDFIGRDGSYILLTPDGNIESFIAEMLGLYLDGKNKFEIFWNSEARFVVAGANEFSMSQQMDIFDSFSKLRIYNCIIVSREHYDIDKKYSSQINVNNVDTGMKLLIYTWFPYRSSDRCTEVKDITLLDSWVISALGHFTKNTDLFPIKISNRLNGCPMRAVVRNGYLIFTTFYFTQQDSNGDTLPEVHGIEFNLLKIVLKQMNMTFIHVPTPEGFEIEKGLTANLISTMLAKEAYIALGDMGTHYLIGQVLDSTNSYYTKSVRWYVPCSFKYSSWINIFSILSVELCLVLIIAIVIVAILTTLVGRYSCMSEWERYKTLSSSLTNIWAVILGVSVSKLPRAPALRSLFLAWVCFSVTFGTVFQTFLKAFVYKTPIQNIKMLYESGIKLYYPPDFNFIFENGEDSEVSKVQKNLANCPSYLDCINWAKYHKNISILFSDDDMVICNVYSIMLDENSEPYMCKLKDGVVYNDGLRMIMLHGDPLMRRVTEIINRVVEAGLYNFWISQYLHVVKLETGEISLFQPFDGFHSYNLYNMQPAFYLLLMGWCLSALCFMFEFLYNRISSKRKCI